MFDTKTALARLKQIQKQIASSDIEFSDLEYDEATAIVSEWKSQLADDHPAGGKLNEFLRQLDAIRGGQGALELHMGWAAESLESLSVPWMLEL